MKIYHGSCQIIEKPVFGAGNAYNDYGLGFYCTRYMELAKEWGCDSQKDGYANCYELDTNGLSILELNGEQYHILNWLAILLDNRTVDLGGTIANTGLQYIRDEFGISYKEYDVICGYRADDSYFSFARAFLNNTISLETLNKVLYLGDLGEQIVLKSKKAFEHISYIGYEDALSLKFYQSKKGRDEKARGRFKDLSRSQSYNDTFLMDIVRGGWKNDDTRIQRIVY